MRPWIVVVATAGVLAACGGSGSPEGEVTLASANPSRLTLTAFSGAIPGGRVTLRAGGDVGALDGRTLFVGVEASSTLFDTISSLSPNPAAASLEVALTSSAAPLEPGTYSGELLIHACLDASCGQELRGSPKKVTYQVTILGGLSIAEESVDLVVPFGTEVPVRRIAVGLPVGVTGWNLTDLYGSYQVSAAKAGDEAPALDVRFLMDAPGVYLHEYLVNATAPDPNGGSAIFQKHLTLRYQITAVQGLPCVLSPAEATHAFTIGPWAQGRGTPRITCQVVGGSLERSLVYVAAPPEATAHPLVDEWLYLASFGDYAVSPCGYSPDSPTWLPAGTYEGIVRYTYTEPGGAVAQLDHAVTMTIAAP